MLEPYYAFQLELPEQMAGRALTDIERMSGTCRIAHLTEETAVLTGTAPVVELRHYQQEVQAYTGGRGRLYCSMQGYDACHNPDEVIERIGYDAEQDTANPTGSVFYEHGSSLVVPWDKVKDYMHGESVLQSRPNVPSLTAAKKRIKGRIGWSRRRLIRSSSKLILLTKAKAARDKNAGLLQKTATKQMRS